MNITARLKAVALVVSFLLTSQLYAISLEFKIDINSSGPSIYACDAGLKHTRIPTQRICYDRTDPSQSCEIDDCEGVVDCNCVCTGSTDNVDGHNRLDMMRVSYSNWVDNGEDTPALTKKSYAAGNGSFKRVFAGTDEWDKMLHTLEYDLGSEIYGAEMYLDVCYRGPQIEYWEAVQNGFSANDTPNHTMNLQTTITDLSNVLGDGTDYASLADLEVKVEAICDLQGEGAYVYARGNDGNYDNAQAHQLLNNLSGGDALHSGTTKVSVPFQDFDTDVKDLYDGWINLRNAKAPRFCKVRYTFKENMVNSGSGTDLIRRWQHQKARICTYTEINEGADD